MAQLHELHSELKLRYAMRFRAKSNAGHLNLLTKTGLSLGQLWTSSTHELGP